MNKSRRKRHRVIFWVWIRMWSVKGRDWLHYHDDNKDDKLIAGRQEIMIIYISLKFFKIIDDYLYRLENIWYDMYLVLIR